MEAFGSRLAAPWLTAFGLCIGLGMFASGLAIMIDLRADAWHQAETAAPKLVHDLTRDLLRNVTLYDLSLQGIRQIMEQPDIGLLSPETRHMALFNRTATSEYLGAMLVLDANGTVVADTRSPHPAPVNMADRDFFQVQRDRADVGLYLSRPYRSQLRQGDWSIAIGRRISRPDGSFGGIVSGALRLAYFRNIFGTPDIGAHGVIMLLRTDGRVMVWLPFQDDRIDLDCRDDPLFRQLAASPSGKLTAKSGLDGVERLYAFSRVGDLPLVLAVGFASSDIRARWSGLMAAIGLGLIALSGGTVAVCLLFSRAIRRRSLAEDAMRKTVGEWQEIAATDALTGLANRRTFDASLIREWKMAIRARTAVGLLILDADHFKLYNDHYGHPKGDAVLRAIAACITNGLLRTGDLGSRIGGEEFAVLLPHVDLPGAVAVAERIRSGLAQLAIPHAKNPKGQVTVSIGAAVLRPSIGDAEASLIALADEALYQAKRTGRDRVCSRDDRSPQSEPAGPEPGHELSATGQPPGTGVARPPVGTN